MAERLVVLITGASSGIGQATALEFARRRAALVLLARNKDALENVAAQCRAYGADALVHVADVGEAPALEVACAAAVHSFGRIDIWISAASVLQFGRFEDIPADMFDHIIRTNVIGMANGARIALRQFRAQGDRGTLINVGSMLGVASEPFLSPYVTSKFALRGLTASLRQEVRDRPGIRVCAVLPWAVDTPVYQKAGNVFGRRVRSVAPLYAAETVARAIVRLAQRPRREAPIGLLSYLLMGGVKVAPFLIERLIARFGPRLQFEPERQEKTAGNLFESAGPHAIDGGWRRYWKDRLFGKR